MAPLSPTLAIAGGTLDHFLTISNACGRRDRKISIDFDVMHACYMHTYALMRLRANFNRSWNCLLLKSMQIPAPVEARADLPKKASMHVSRMHDGGIDRYPAISTSACVRNGRLRRPRPRPERLLACRAGESGAAPAEARCRAVHPYGPRPHVPHRRRRGRHRYPLISRRESKRSIFAPRGAFGCGAAMITGGRIRDPMPSGTLTPFPHTMRGRPDHRSASAVPVLTVGAGGRNV